MRILGERWAGLRKELDEQGLAKLHSLMYYMRAPDYQLVAEILGVNEEEARNKVRQVLDLIEKWMPDEVMRDVLGE